MILTRLELTQNQVDMVFREQLSSICGDYKIKGEEVFDVEYCGRDDCNGHEQIIDTTSLENKRRVAAILLRELL